MPGGELNQLAEARLGESSLTLAQKTPADRQQFKQLARRRPLSNSDLYYAIAHYKAKLQTLVRSIKTDQYKDEFERQRRERLRLDYRTIRDRVKEADGPSPLAKALLKKVAEMELTMLDDDDIELNGDNHTQTVRLGARDAEGDDHLDEEDEEVVWSDDEELDQDDDFEVDGEGSEHTDTTDREGDPRGTKVESTTTKLAQQATAADRVPRRKAASRDEPVPPSLQQSQYHDLQVNQGHRLISQGCRKD